MPEIENAPMLPDAEAKQIENLLDAHGQEKGFAWDEQRLNLILREDGAIIGGLLGKTVQGWLYIAEFAVETGWRGQGYGQKLILEAERIALERGCHGVWLHTHSFQAPGFYEKLGYRQFGVLEDFPKGEQRIFYMKRLVLDD